MFMIFTKNLPLLVAILLGFSHSTASPRKSPLSSSISSKPKPSNPEISVNDALNILQTMLKEALLCRLAHDFAQTMADRLGPNTPGSQCLIDASERYLENTTEASDFIRCARRILPEKSDSKMADYCNIALTCAACSEGATADELIDT